MGHIPEDDNLEEFMDASAEEWSKPEETSSEPESKDEPTDRWGSPTPQGSTVSDENRWGSEPVDTPHYEGKPESKKGGAKWWIIAVIVIAVLCLCTCVVLGGLEAFQVINLF